MNEIMIAGFADEFEKIAGLPSRLRSYIGKAQYNAIRAGRVGNVPQIHVPEGMKPLGKVDQLRINRWATGQAGASASHDFLRQTYRAAGREMKPQSLMQRFREKLKLPQHILHTLSYRPRVAARSAAI